MVEKCPVCNSVAKQIDHLSSREYYTECVRCGTFKYNQYTHEIVSKFDLSKKLALSHWIRKQNEIGNQPDFQGVIYTKEFLESLELPNAGEQADNLIKYLGEKIKAVSSGYQFNYNEQFGLCAIIGCMTIEDLIYIINYLVKDKKLIRLLNPNSDMQYLHRNKQYFDIGLAPEGWVKIEEFKKKLATNFVAKEQENTKSINSPIVIDNKESKTNNLDSNNIEIKDSKKTPLYKSMLFWAIVSVVVAVVFGVLNYDPSNSIENNENSNSIIVQGDNNTVNYNSNNSTEI
ncbi:MAG: hypothetical protein KAS62_10670, partial [Candidatus Delongbacteria bacterium]|nr:hypothetical protein [Candidatus Delongbacteria bacterium]